MGGQAAGRGRWVQGHRVARTRFACCAWRMHGVRPRCFPQSHNPVLKGQTKRRATDSTATINQDKLLRLLANASAQQEGSRPSPTPEPAPALPTPAHLQQRRQQVGRELLKQLRVVLQKLGALARLLLLRRPRRSRLVTACAGWLVLAGCRAERAQHSSTRAESTLCDGRWSLAQVMQQINTSPTNHSCQCAVCNRANFAGAAPTPPRSHHSGRCTLHRCPITCCGLLRPARSVAAAHLWLDRARAARPAPWPPPHRGWAAAAVPSG